MGSEATAAAAGSTPQGFPDSHAVQVANLPDPVEPKEIHEHFKYCGDVRRIILKVDRTTGKFTGVAFIDFKDEMHVSDALLLDESDLKGNHLKVTKKKSQPSFGSKGSGKGGKFKGGGGYKGGVYAWVPSLGMPSDKDGGWGGGFCGGKGGKGGKGKKGKFSPY